MTDIDTSAEAVERLAHWCVGAPPVWPTDVPMPVSFTAAIAATLRALVRERDKAIEARTEAIKEMCKQAREAGSLQGIADGKDIIIRQLEAQRDEARALFEEMRAPYAIIVRREWQAGAKAMRDRAAQEAKVAWLTTSYGEIADADAMNAVCEHAEQSIRALPIPERPT